MQAIRHMRAKLKMPPEKHLAESEIASLIGKYQAKYALLKKDHWAWQPLRDVQPPAVRDAAWARGDVAGHVVTEIFA